MSSFTRITIDLRATDTIAPGHRRKTRQKHTRPALPRPTNRARRESDRISQDIRPITGHANLRLLPAPRKGRLLLAAH